MAEAINNFINDWIVGAEPADGWVVPGYLIAALIHCLLLIHVIAVGAGVLVAGLRGALVTGLRVTLFGAGATAVVAAPCSGCIQNR